MKTALLAFFVLLSGVTAHANYRTDSIDSAIPCYLAGNSGSVSINRDRTTITFSLNGRKPAKYQVTKRVADNNTSVSYLAGSAIMTFSDAGDKLALNGTGYPLDCPQ